MHVLLTLPLSLGAGGFLGYTVYGDKFHYTPMPPLEVTSSSSPIKVLCDYTILIGQSPLVVFTIIEETEKLIRTFS